LLGFIVGMTQARVFPLPLHILTWQDLNQGFVQQLDRFRFFSASGVGSVWFQNIRAILLATLLGIFSFGVLGILVVMLPFALMGYFMVNLAGAGISPLSFLAGFVLPHGVVEVPAILLAGAAILRLGATLAAPAPGRTIGEAWLQALGEWARVFVGLVIPLLLCAATLEVLVTPRVALWILGN
jgi:uncharacterized membrane protein SpoIIM required for sporulation